MRKLIAIISLLLASAVSFTSPSGATNSSGLNHWAYDGKFGFEVTRLHCGQKSISSNFDTETAQGMFCVVSLKIKNISHQSQTPDDSAQYLYDASGNKYSADEQADIYLNTSQIWTASSGLNPGLTESGFIYFDVPVGTAISSMQVHDSAFSGGATIDLQGVEFGPWIEDKIVGNEVAFHLTPELLGATCESKQSTRTLNSSTVMKINGRGGVNLVTVKVGAGKNIVDKDFSGKKVKACIYSDKVWLPLNQSNYYFKFVDDGSTFTNLSISSREVRVAVKRGLGLNLQLSSSN